MQNEYQLKFFLLTHPSNHLIAKESYSHNSKVIIIPYVTDSYGVDPEISNIVVLDLTNVRQHLENIEAQQHTILDQLSALPKDVFFHGYL